MKCPFCAEAIKDDAVRCKHCHADVSPGVCKSCGKLNRLEANSCRFCGSDKLILSSETQAYVSHMIEGEQHLKSEAWSEAVASCDKALQLKPGDATAIAQKALVERKRQEVLKKRGMVLIPAGEFLMGSPENVGCYDNEHPQHMVFLDSFYIDKYKVTVGQYKVFAKATGREMLEQPPGSTDQHPVVYVTWEDADAYCKWAGGRLPTEAEWEKAARGGTTTKWSFGDDASKLCEYAWYKENAGDSTHPVGQKKPNQYGLYDMHGNGWEWCADWYGEDYYKNSPSKNPKGPAEGEGRVVHGGSWLEIFDSTHSGSRSLNWPDSRCDNVGFRCVG